MPQDGLRSVVYRSFVTCDDPKGVAECKTTRKSKKMEDKIRNQTIKQNSSNSTSYYDEERKDKVPKGSTQDQLQNLSSFRIMEVSREADKLNEVVDSWSNRSIFEKQSKYIANDLLKGALDLEESLVMLGKLQEASQYHVAKSKKRQDEKPDHHHFVDFDYHNQTMEFQKPRISSVDRDCYDELREVIRESFARQNLLPKVSPNDLDLPSSSSSQSSLIHSHSYSNCLKPKGSSNLIAKLMGLDEVPSEVVNSVVYKQMMEKERFLNQRSPFLDIDLPTRPRKPQFVVQNKVVRERGRTLEEIMEAMQFKGLVERDSSMMMMDGPNDGEYVSFSRKSSAVEGPSTPIVIMKPLRVPVLGAEGNYWIDEDKSIKSRQMYLSRKMSDDDDALEVPRGQLKFTETNEKQQRAGRIPNQKVVDKHKQGKKPEKSPAPTLIKKTSKIQDRLSTTKINQSKPLVPRVQKKENNVQKTTRKQVEIEDAKYQESAKTQDVGKITTSKHRKTARESNASKCQIARGKTAARDQQHMKPTSVKSSMPKKNSNQGKPNGKPSAALVENIQNDDTVTINTESNIQRLLMNSTTSDQITEDMMNASYTSTPDKSGISANSPCESSGPGIKDEDKYTDDSSCIPCRNLYKMKGHKSITNTRYLLLSSTSFVNRAEELFDTGKCEPTTVLQTAWLPDDRQMLDNSLLLECAKEILERKSLRLTRKINSFSQNLFKMPKCHHLSLQQLVGEISNGIEDLNNYSESCVDSVVVHSIYSMLQRDLWLNEEVTGAWDLGWRNKYTLEEVNQVVHDVEKLVLSELVADVVTQVMI